MYQSYGPLFSPEFQFRSISCELIDRISPNFIYALILARSMLGLLAVIFAYLQQSYGPWFMSEFRFHSISGEQMDRVSPNFVYAFILTISRLGLLPVILCLFKTEIWPFIGFRIFFPAQCP